MLLNVAYKVFSNILFDCLFKYTEKILGNYQCGFQPGRSTVNQIFTIMQIEWKNVILVYTIYLLIFKLLIKLYKREIESCYKRV
jgi:hypothetical protein